MTAGTLATAGQALKLGGKVSLNRMPAHRMVRRLGKRVLRPGGGEMSRWLVDALAIGAEDDVVQLRPGLGTLTGLALDAGPRSYTGIERGEVEAARVRAMIRGPRRHCLVAPVTETGLADGSASVLFSEALLTLAPDAVKTRALAEARRVLRAGGRYGMHEIVMMPDGLTEAAKDDITRVLTETLRIDARPFTVPEWRQQVEAAGFTVDAERQGPVMLLQPRSLLADEGVARTFAILGSSLAHPSVLPRLVDIARVFNRYRDHIGALALTAVRA
jgi:hypothetical protein